MEFTDLQIKEFTVGALTIWKTQRGYTFKRFTKAQEKAFGSVFSRWATRSRYTSGIRIDFHTDATAVHVTVGVRSKYEILVDDLSVCFAALKGNETLSVDLDGADHRVTIVLPNLSGGKIRSIILEGETYVRPHCYTKKVAFYGDSITQGSTSIKSSQCYAWLLTRYFDLHSMNFGVGGLRFQPESLVDIGYRPDVVFIALGTNNYGTNRSMEELRRNCSEYFDKIALIYPQSHIICITPIWRADGDEPKALGTIHDARSYIHEQATARGFTVVDGFSLVPHLTEYYADQRLHPNDVGFALYAQNLIKAVRQYL